MPEITNAGNHQCQKLLVLETNNADRGVELLMLQSFDEKIFKLVFFVNCIYCKGRLREGI
jgi:hypothetical protein